MNIDDQVKAIELINAVKSARDIANHASAQAANAEQVLADFLGANDMIIEHKKIAFSATPADLYIPALPSDPEQIFDLVEDYPEPEDTWQPR